MGAGRCSREWHHVAAAGPAHIGAAHLPSRGAAGVPAGCGSSCLGWRPQLGGEEGAAIAHKATWTEAAAHQAAGTRVLGPGGCHPACRGQSGQWTGARAEAQAPAVVGRWQPSSPSAGMLWGQAQRPPRPALAGSVLCPHVGQGRSEWDKLPRQALQGGGLGDLGDCSCAGPGLLARPP